MEQFQELVLIFGLIALSLFSIKLSYDTMKTTERMNQSIQMMFVKS